MIADLLTAVILLAGFALLRERRSAVLIDVAAGQSLATAMLCFWQGFARGAADLMAAALIILLAGALALPWLLRQIPPHSVLPASRAMLVLALGGVCLALFATQGLGALREPAALTLSVLLLALMLLAGRPGPLAQTIGLTVLANALLLALATLGGRMAPLLGVLLWAPSGWLAFRLRRDG